MIRSPFPYSLIDIDNQNEQKLFLTEERTIDSLDKLKLGDRGVMSINALDALYAQSYLSNLPTDDNANYILILNPFSSIQLRAELKHYYEPARDEDLERMQEFFTGTLGKPIENLKNYYFGNYLHFDIFIARQLAFRDRSNQLTQTKAKVETKEVTMLHSLFLSPDAFFRSLHYARMMKENTETFYSANDFFFIRDCYQSEIPYIKILTAKEAF